MSEQLPQLAGQNEPVLRMAAEWTKQEEEFLVLACEFTNQGWIAIAEGLKHLDTGHTVYRGSHAVKEHFEGALRQSDNVLDLWQQIRIAKTTNTRVDKSISNKAYHYLSVAFLDTQYTYRDVWM